MIVDRKRYEGPIRLIGYRHTPAGYVEMPLDAQGRLALPVFGLILMPRETGSYSMTGRRGRNWATTRP